MHDLNVVRQNYVKNDCADLIHPWVVDCTQLESAMSVIN